MNSEPSWTATPSPGGTLPVPNATTPWLGRDEELAKVEIGILATVLVLATGGNLAVLLTLGRHGHKPSRMHLFVLHLALTDLGVALFQILPMWLSPSPCFWATSAAAATPGSTWASTVACCHVP
uniref:Vasopressin V1b receptor variant n=1 Tax=Rattus norvegicus TaxID=10116 RepID=O70501_RAT|nr:vasopressin V1b receptor variant [Rattus norvegicus]